MASHLRVHLHGERGNLPARRRAGHGLGDVAQVDLERLDDGRRRLRACPQAARPVVAAQAEGFDCDDTSSDFYPGAPETDCSDPNDYNCDGSVGYADADGDGAAA